MQIIKRPKQSAHMRQSRKNHSNMQHLMAIAINIILKRPQFLRDLPTYQQCKYHKYSNYIYTNPRSIYDRSCQIKNRHQCHPIDAHALLLNRQAVQDNAVDYEDEAGEP